MQARVTLLVAFSLLVPLCASLPQSSCSLPQLRHKPPQPWHSRRAAVRQIAQGAAWCFGLGPFPANAGSPAAPTPAPAVPTSPTAPSIPASALEDAIGDKTIGEIPASGIIFKDIVKVDRVSDPKVQGVQLYVSDFQRPITERLQSDFFGDPALAAVTCMRTGKVTIDPSVEASAEGEEVFSQARSLLFKSVKVRRLYDKEAQALIYVSYSTRLDKSDDQNKARFRTSICVVNLNDP